MSKKIKLPIETDRLIINEFASSDFSRLRNIAININYQSDTQKGYMPFYAFQVKKEDPDREKKISNKAAQFLLKSVKEKEEEPRVTYRMAIRLKEDERLIGNVTINMLPVEENGKLVYGDRGCFIAPEYAKQGYAIEAVRAVSHHFFKEYDKMDITAHPDNEHSRSLIERSGGKEVGYKEASGYGNKEPRTVYEIQKKDFYNSSPFNQKMPNLLNNLLKKANEKNV